MVKLIEQLKDIETKINKNKEDERYKYEKKIIDKIEEEPNVFYRFAKRKSKAKSDIGPLKDGDKVTNDEVKMADILMKQYRDVCSVPFYNIRGYKFKSELCFKPILTKK